MLVTPLFSLVHKRRRVVGARDVDRPAQGDRPSGRLSPKRREWFPLKFRRQVVKCDIDAGAANGHPRREPGRDRFVHFDVSSGDVGRIAADQDRRVIVAEDDDRRLESLVTPPVDRNGLPPACHSVIRRDFYDHRGPSGRAMRPGQELEIAGRGINDGEKVDASDPRAACASGPGKTRKVHSRQSRYTRESRARGPRDRGGAQKLTPVHLSR